LLASNQEVLESAVLNNTKYTLFLITTEKKKLLLCVSGEYLEWNTELSKKKVQNYRIEILTGTTFDGPTVLAWVMWLHGKEDKFLRGIQLEQCNFRNLLQDVGVNNRKK